MTPAASAIRTRAANCFFNVEKQPAVRRRARFLSARLRPTANSTKNQRARQEIEQHQHRHQHRNTQQLVRQAFLGADEDDLCLLPLSIKSLNLQFQSTTPNARSWKMTRVANLLTLLCALAASVDAVKLTSLPSQLPAPAKAMKKAIQVRPFTDASSRANSRRASSIAHPHSINTASRGHPEPRQRRVGQHVFPRRGPRPGEHGRGLKDGSLGVV